MQKNINFRLDNDDYEKLNKIAAELGMNNLSMLMRMLVRKKLTEVEKKGWNPEQFLK